MSTTMLAGGPPALTDGVVTLRGHRADDVEAMVRQCRDPQMQAWTRVPIPFERADAETFLAEMADGWRSGTTCGFAIEAAGGFAGTVDLRLGPAAGAEVGYALGPWARGAGVMSRALRLALTWGFSDAAGAPGLEVVHWQAQVGNWASRRVAWATGFRVEGTVRGLLPHRGRRQDAWFGSIRRGDPMAPPHAWFDPPRLQTAGVLLREHESTDLPRIVEACQDAETRQWLSGLPMPYTESDAAQHLSMIKTEQACGRGVYWVVADPDDEQLLGEIGLFVRDDAGRQAEVGYWTHPVGRRRGITTAATRLVARHALLPRDVGGLGLDRVMLRAAAGNAASLRVAEKAGFTRTGIDRRADRLRDGTIDDDIRFDLLADELPPARDLPLDDEPR